MSNNYYTFLIIIIIHYIAAKSLLNKLQGVPQLPFFKYLYMGDIFDTDLSSVN